MGRQRQGVTFAVESSGQSVGSTSDAFHFAHRTLSGDGEMIAKVDSMLGTDGNAADVFSQAGIMFRDGTAANTRFVFMNLGLTSGTAYRSVFYYRTPTGGTAAYTEGSGVISGWIKLTRSGTTFTGYASSDGSTWTQVGTITISGMSSSLEVGLALSANGYGHVDTASFSNVKLTVAAPTNVIATAIHAHEIDLAWNDNSQSEDGFAIDRSSDSGTTWTNVALDKCRQPHRRDGIRRFDGGPRHQLHLPCSQLHLPRPRQHDPHRQHVVFRRRDVEQREHHRVGGWSDRHVLRQR